MGCRFLFTLLSAAVFSSACADSRSGDGGDPTASLPLAAGVEITAVDLYQAVSIPIMKDGDAVDPGLAPIVGGKDALVRIFVEPDDSYEPRELMGRVELIDGDGKVHFTTEQEISAGPSSEAALPSTLNVEVPGEDLKEGQSISVSVREVSGGAAQDGDTSGAKWPSDGSQDLEIQESKPRMKLVLVPIEYNADGSGRLPDTSEEALQGYEDLFKGMYPINGIDISVDDPLPLSTAVAAAGGGWESMLDAVTGRRSQNGAAKDEFYYGLVVPNDTFSGYCNMGCVTGLSWSVTSVPGMTAQQAGAGIGYGGNSLTYSTYTAAHEVGHLFGRLHAPCQVNQGVDSAYPYANGSTGVMGYDPTAEQLKNPSSYSDIMGYCTTQWISDYNFGALYARFEAVTTLADAKIAPPADGNTTWLSVVVHADGEVLRGPALESDLPITGEPRTVALLDDSGAVVQTIEGAFIAYSDLGGGMIAFRAPAPEIAAARVEGLEPVSLR
jgi:hypothetical protein